uniref:Uncharacterized protein n=4 Tax=Avena sativa TaxID=4498 RepID=A0ACD6ABD8_AVESA
MDKEGTSSDTALQKQEWARTQDVLKSRLILDDDFEWSLPSVSSDSDQNDARDKLKYIGGVDISFLKEDPSTACAAVVVLDADTLEIVHEEFDLVRMQVPYVPGFLAFREVYSTPLHVCRLSTVDTFYALQFRELISFFLWQ